MNVVAVPAVHFTFTRRTFTVARPPPVSMMMSVVAAKLVTDPVAVKTLPMDVQEAAPPPEPEQDMVYLFPLMRASSMRASRASICWTWTFNPETSAFMVAMSARRSSAQLW